MSDQIDKEIDAIKTVLGALEPLPPQVRVSVLQYVTGRLKISHEASEKLAVTASAPGTEGRLQPRRGHCYFTAERI